MYDFLFDSYFAVATLNDKNWKNDKPIEKNVHVMLKRVRDDVIKMMAFLAKNEAGLLAAILTANGGQMPNVNMTQATTTRGGYSNIDPFEMLGLKSHVRDFVLSEWKDRFLLQAKKNFENAGLMECMKQLYPPELYPQLY